MKRVAEVTLSARVLSTLEEIALSSYPREVVASLHGYVLEREGKVTVRLSAVKETYVEATASTPVTVYFRLAERAFRNPSWVGLWHSHPEGVAWPSLRDLRVAVAMAHRRGRPIVLGVTSVRLLNSRTLFTHLFLVVDSGGRVLGLKRVALRQKEYR